MTDHLSPTEQLVQRFLDQELSADERIQFIVALGRDSMLRERVLEMEQLVLDASKLTRPAVPDGFVAQVMERTLPANAQRRSAEARRRAPTRHARGWCVESPGRGIVGAPGAAVEPGECRSGRLSHAGCDWWRRDPGTALARGVRGGVHRFCNRAATPPVVLVRLVVVQPGARVVQAAGDFNGWNPLKTPLEQTADGAWTVTLPLEPGRYEYQFVVDGDQWISDPFAAEQNDDGFGARNAVLDVRPPETI